MEKKAQLTADQLRDVDAYLGKLVHAKAGKDDEKICPACHQPIIKRDGLTHRMLVVTGRSTGVYLPVREGETIVIGRGSKCDVRLEDGAASRQHAEIKGKQKSCLIRDLSSANGTYVNGKRVETKEIADGDVVQIGATRIIFYIQED